jgi:hypothetical protein
LPDTQNYTSSRLGGSPEIFYSQVEWIVTNRTLNTVAVLHVGDLIQYNGSVEAEWFVGTNALYRLEDPLTTGRPDGIPYIIAPGNHDGAPWNGYAGFNKYFGTNHFSDRSYYGGHYGTNNNNSYILFSSAGMDFLILALEYDPPSAALEWANQVLVTNLNRKAIIVSHSILSPTSAGVIFNSQGQKIYNALKTNSNIFMMFCGHEPTTAHRRDVFQGGVIDSFLNDFEAEPNGGNGWLRTVEFLPATNMLNIRTYSPVLGNFSIGSWFEWQIPCDMSLTGKGYFLADSFTTNGSPVLAISKPLTNLATNTWYEWYVQVDTASATFTSPQWMFYNRAPSQNQAFNLISSSADLLGHASFSWVSTGGSRYRIEVCDGAPGLWREVARPASEEVDGSPAGISSIQFFTDDFKYTGGPPPGGARFFRIRKVDQNP